MRDTCIPKMLKDPRRLYAPGRLCHIVERRPFRSRQSREWNGRRLWLENTVKSTKSMSVPHAYSPSQYDTFDEPEDGEKSHKSTGESCVGPSGKSKKKDSWNELIERLFDKDESGHMVLEKSHRDD